MIEIILGLIVLPCICIWVLAQKLIPKQSKPKVKQTSACQTPKHIEQITPTPTPDPKQKEIIEEIAKGYWEEYKRDIDEDRKRREVEAIINRDKQQYFACCQATKRCLPIVIKTLKRIDGGQSLIDKIKENTPLFTKEFIILCATYNFLFLSTWSRNPSDKYGLNNGAYRLYKMLKLSTTPNDSHVSNRDIDEIENKIEFYRGEIEFINNSKFGLPINLLYALFNPEKKIDISNAITNINPIDACIIWQTIAREIKIEQANIL